MPHLQNVDWYGFLVDFQTAIVGVIGFLGVVMTIKTTAKLSRQQQEHQLSFFEKTQKLADLQRAHSLRRTLLVLIEHLRRETSVNVNSLQFDGSGKAVAVRKPKVEQLKSLIPELGALSKIEISLTVSILTICDSSRSTLEEYVLDTSDSEMAFVPPEKIENFLKQQKDLFEMLELAKATCEKALL